ncbi:MAG: glycosyltransferase family 2 protein [Candidatus Aminicenantes bacterium]|nr:glycosyltransferase family 2 protein [Candidatus Aminicenantes bacterium]
MTSVLRLLRDGLFVFSVIFIWLMLLYQFVLTAAGFRFRRRLDKEGEPEDGDIELPGVSILVPARNEAKVILDLLERLGGLDYPAGRLEFIIIDDGSTDGTGDLVESAAAADPRVRLLRIPPDRSGRGKSAALNTALPQARFEAVAVYDADNRPEPDSLARLCRALVSDPGLAAVTGLFRVYNKDRNLLTRFIHLESLAFQGIIQAGRWFLMKIAFLPGTNFVIWRKDLEAAGGWDEEALTEDTELTFRIYERKRLVKFLPTAVTWEQEPERLRTWIRQRTRWARGNNYVLGSRLPTLLRRRPNLMVFELLNLFFLYYVFVFAILFSDLIFILSLLGLTRLRIAGPFTELWALAAALFTLEVLLALSYEREDSRAMFGVTVLAYLTYTKLWVFVVLRGLVQDVVLRRKRIWDKTERFDSHPPPKRGSA